MTLLLPPTSEGIAEAAHLLASGRLVAFPTETVYGLGVDATNDEAVERLYAAKGRPGHNPLIVHVEGIEAAWRWAAEWPPEATRLALRFWPGPLTIVVRAAAGLSRAALAGGDTVGLRAPDHAVARALLAAAGVPVAAPSANRSGHVSPTDAAHVLADLGGRIDAILDAGRCRRGIESTVVDLVARPPRVLRPGPIGREHLAAELGEEVGGEAGIPAADTRVAPAAPAEPLRSPGLLERHYAPRTPARLVAPAALDLRPEGTAAIHLDGRGDAPLRGRDARGPWWRLPAEPAACAEALYHTLREADAAGADALWIARPPDAPGWEAIHDRLRRATHAAGEPPA